MEHRDLFRIRDKQRSAGGQGEIRRFGLSALGLALMVCLLAPGWGTAAASDPTREELLAGVAMPPEGDRRGQMDVVGISSDRSQMDRVIAQGNELAAPRWTELRARLEWDDRSSWIAGVCPHDDYYYAARLYSLLLQGVRARHVVLVGVFHRARVFDCRDVLVFDSFESWHGPYGPVSISPLRDELIRRLPPEDRVASREMHVVEHSLEALVPFLQAYNPEVEIVPILVPHMAWPTLDRLAADLAQALESVLTERGWRLGRDVAIICSADAVHYGDAGWGGRSYADFGVGLEGYRKAVERDMKLAEATLCGPVTRTRLRRFMEQCVNPEDVSEYRITWCGRFSIPFGLDVASRLSGAMLGRPLQGTLLDYGTSVSEQSLDREGLGGLGPTAPSNFHHFVGYAALGYR